MIKELRIGNLILNDQGKASEVSELNKLSVWSDTEGVFSIVINPKGIELTPEWLERFGFYKYSHDWILQQGDANQIPLIRIFNPSEKLFLEDKSGTIIRTVHHLQNFFHALYSRELELKK